MPTGSVASLSHPSPPVNYAKPSQDSHSALTDGPRQGLGLPMGPEWTSWKSLPLTVSCPRQVMLQEKNQMMSEMARFDDLICASQSSHVLTASTVGASRACRASVVIRSFGLFWERLVDWEGAQQQAPAGIGSAGVC